MIIKNIPKKHIKIIDNSKIIKKYDDQRVIMKEYSMKMKSDLKSFAMKNDCLEILPNVYIDNFNRMIRFDNFPEYCYYVYLKNTSRIKFLTIEELINFYNKEEK